VAFIALVEVAAIDLVRELQETVVEAVLTDDRDCQQPV